MKYTGHFTGHAITAVFTDIQSLERTAFHTSLVGKYKIRYPAVFLKYIGFHLL